MVFDSSYDGVEEIRDDPEGGEKSKGGRGKEKGRCELELLASGSPSLDPGVDRELTLFCSRASESHPAYPYAADLRRIRREIDGAERWRERTTSLESH